MTQRTTKPFRVLVVDDEKDMRETCVRILERMGLSADAVGTVDKARELAQSYPYSLAILDIRLPDGDGISLLRALKAINPEIKAIMITAYASPESDLKSFQEGAVEYLPKPFTATQFKDAVSHALNLIYMEPDTAQDADLKDLEKFGLYGHDPRFLQAVRKLLHVAKTDASVLIYGESGTGKELFARILHKLSHRAGGPFVPIDCGAIPETLLESELFGYEKGAFTGATSTRVGLLEQAHGGTLFLDEIANLPLPLQPKLLRVLQEQTIRRLGGGREISVDFRVVAATHVDLDKLARSGRFREDLLYRLRVVEIKIPPLRERLSDIPLLAEMFFQRLKPRFRKPLRGLSRAMHLILKHYPWPGNVRELQNAIEHAMAVSRGPLLTPLDLPEYIVQSISNRIPERRPLPYHQARKIVLRQFERGYLTRLLELTRGNVSEAARLSGLKRTSLYKMFNRYDLNPDEFRQRKKEPHDADNGSI